MNNKRSLALTLMVSALMLSLTACATGYSNMVIGEADRNNDKRLTYEEYYGLVTNDANAAEYRIQARGRGKTVRQYSFERFNAMDTNRDGFVNSEEIKAYTFK